MEHIRKPKPLTDEEIKAKILRGYRKLLEESKKPLPPTEWYERKKNEDTK